MDLLAPLFSRFNLTAKVFYSGTLCTTVTFDDPQGRGHLHVLRAGSVKVFSPYSKAIEIAEPSVLFFPKPAKHRFRVDNPDGAELVCATIDFGGGMEDPILRGLPDMVLVPLIEVTGIDAALTLLFDEAFGQRAARQAAINRLAEYFLLLLLRFTVEAKVVDGGVLAGLGDPKLSLAIHAINERPEHDWSLEGLAKLAGMSRSRFAEHFRATTGITPADYLTDWRISVAQTLLRQGKPLKMVAPMVGYASAIALTRAFERRVGVTPSEWLKVT